MGSRRLPPRSFPPHKAGGPATGSHWAGACWSNCEAAIGFTTGFSTVVVGVHIGIDDDGPCSAPRLADSPNSTPHASHRGARLHSSLNDHGAGRILMSWTGQQRRVHRLSDCMHHVVRRDTAFHRLPGIRCSIGLPSSDPGDRPVRRTLLVVASNCWSPVPRVGREALLFLLVGVSTTRGTYLVRVLVVYPSSPVLLFQNWIDPGSVRSATRIVASSPTRRKHTQARVERAPRRGPYLDLDTVSTRTTSPAVGEYGCGLSEATTAAIRL